MSILDPITCYRNLVCKKSKGITIYLTSLNSGQCNEATNSLGPRMRTGILLNDFHHQIRQKILNVQFNEFDRFDPIITFSYAKHFEEE